LEYEQLLLLKLSYLVVGYLSRIVNKTVDLAWVG